MTNKKEAYIAGEKSMQTRTLVCLYKLSGDHVNNEFIPRSELSKVIRDIENAYSAEYDVKL